VLKYESPHKIAYFHVILSLINNNMVHHQLVMAAADDGWVLAVRNTRRGRKRTFAASSTAKCRPLFRFTAEAKAAEEHLTEAETVERVDGVQRTVERVKLEMPWKLR
jgi:hypothetical protein